MYKLLYKQSVVNETVIFCSWFLKDERVSDCLMASGRLFHNLAAMYEYECCRYADFELGNTSYHKWKYVCGLTTALQEKIVYLELLNVNHDTFNLQTGLFLVFSDRGADSAPLPPPFLQGITKATTTKLKGYIVRPKMFLLTNETRDIYDWVSVIN